MKETKTKRACAEQTARRQTKVQVLSWGAVVIWAGVIFWMSSNTGSEVNQGLGIISAVKAWLSAVADVLVGPGVDVSPVGHFAEYFVFGCLLANALRTAVGLRAALVVGALAIGSLYGVTDEWHQYFVPARSCDPADWAVDTVASGLGAWATYALMRRCAKKGADSSTT